MDDETLQMDLNWQTRLALEWFKHDPATAGYWPAAASAHDPSAVAHELTAAVNEGVCNGLNATHPIS